MTTAKAIKARRQRARDQVAIESVQQDHASGRAEIGEPDLPADRGRAGSFGVDSLRACDTRNAQPYRRRTWSRRKRLELAKLDDIERRLFVVLSQRQRSRWITVGTSFGTVERLRQTGRSHSVRCSTTGQSCRRRRGCSACRNGGRRLLGLDEPAKLRVETIPLDVVDAEIRRLEAKFADQSSVDQ